MTVESVSDLVDEYREALVAMEGLHLAEDRGARKWNVHVYRVQRAQLGLRCSAEGRAAITELIDDPVPMVAHWAASHALFWSEDRARRHLDDVRAAGGMGSFDAEMTLREFNAGRLRHDWEPPTR